MKLFCLEMRGQALAAGAGHSIAKPFCDAGGRRRFYPDLVTGCSKDSGRGRGGGWTSVAQGEIKWHPYSGKGLPALLEPVTQGRL